MQKNILISMVGLSCLFLVGCGSKVAPTETIDTGMLFSGDQVLTGMQSGENVFDPNTSMREEVTGDVALGETPAGSLVITGQSNSVEVTGSVVATGAALSADIAKMIQDRASKPKDDKKLTEDDIDLIDQVIQKVTNLGN